MITLEEGSVILRNDFPEFRISTPIKNVFECYTSLAAFTESEIQKGHFNKVKRILQSVNELLIQADAQLKMAIENCYLYSLHIEGVAYRELLSLFPESLKSSYLNIVNPRLSI